MIRRPMIALAAAVLLSAPLAAQQPGQNQPATARPGDVVSVDSIIAALYDVISGPAGQKRDWARFHALFIQGARLIPTAKGMDGTIRHRVLTPEDYERTSGALLEQRGFFENEIYRVTETFGNVTHVFSTYESRAKREDPQPSARGINSVQLLNDGSRWWVVSIFWDSERPDNPIPAKYLKN